eukprot:SAG11_NODE_1464_length_4862_cov_1.419064_2_plen_159_part_00
MKRSLHGFAPERCAHFHRNDSLSHRLQPPQLDMANLPVRTRSSHPRGRGRCARQLGLRSRCGSSCAPQPTSWGCRRASTSVSSSPASAPRGQTHNVCRGLGRSDFKPAKATHAEERLRDRAPRVVVPLACRHHSSTNQRQGAALSQDGWCFVCCVDHH